MICSVIGLGYVGLPLAVQIAHKGHIVYGTDLRKDLVHLVNERVSPFVNDSRLSKALKSLAPKTLIASTTFDSVGNSNVLIICVPTPTENSVPDLSLITSACESIGGRIKSGQLVILESTVNPGVTRDVVLPILEELSGLKVGKDFYLAHCPERIDPGNSKLYVGNINRVVGGITPSCTSKALSFYKSIIDAEVLSLGSSEEAEFVKSWENSHRNIMIALANSAAIICDSVGMDINNIISGLQTKIDQFGLSLARPGIGPGGHCIPEDIHYVINKARQHGIDTSFLDGAVELNEKMPSYAVNQLRILVSRNNDRLSEMRVALLGVSYKEDIEDYRRSPALEVGYILTRAVNSVNVYDPYLKLTSTLPIKYANYYKSLEAALEDSDVIFIGTAHTHFKDLITPQLLAKHKIKYILDGRNMLNPEEYLKLGIRYKGIGR